MENIKIGSGLLNKITELFDFSQYSALYIITDSHVQPIYLNRLIKSLQKSFLKNIFFFTFPAGEKNKNLETVKKIYQDMAEKKLDRKTLIINLGGGVVTDLGGFVAATYLRGISFINISTTIEGMVDASIGGKVGVNLNGLKNYIGAFYQSKMVIMDVYTLKTLSKRQLVVGFGEIIKESCKIKANIVEKDERENGLRKILNFGHTTGHAIESLSLKNKNHLFHGEAVAIGIIVAARISHLLKMISKQDFRRIETAIKNAGLPIASPINIPLPTVLNLMQTDKKNTNKTIKWVLLQRIGQAMYNVEVNENVIKKSLSYVL